MTHKRVYEGAWARLRNTSADRAGSIHDDEPARKLGFKGAFVPGTVVGSCAFPAIVAHFGPRWMEGGWYDLTFVSPVYTSEPVRATADEDGDELLLRVEAKDGRLCLAGRAGLRADAVALPWNAAADGQHRADEVFPRSRLGLSCPVKSFELSREAMCTMLDAASDPSPWYRESSPWGEPVAAPEFLMGVALRAVDWNPVHVEGVRQPGMWARHTLVLRQPLRYGISYELHEHLADKGVSARTFYAEFEFRVIGPDGGEIAIGRHKNKWLAAAL